MVVPADGIPAFPGRAYDAHKGDVGRIVVIGGRLDDVGMVGAPALAANAAFRTGAGLVQILTTREAQLPVSILAPCATTRALRDGDASGLASLASEVHADVVAVGPGLSPEVSGEDLVALMAAFDGGIVIDADGLNALARIGRWQAARPAQVVVTPHPGEMRRLLNGLGIDADAGQREAGAEALAGETGAIVVHKGAGTVVTDGQHTCVNGSGNSGVATGGAGDVLTGVVAGLMGQKMGAYEAAVLGVYLHGRAGDLAGEQLGQVSITALDMVDSLADAIQGLKVQRLKVEG